MLFFGFASIMAQTPLGINYQGVARSADGSPLIKQAIGLRVSITIGASGSADYSEEHHIETNEFGLFAVIIGHGQTSGRIADVNWGDGNKWLQIEIDPQDNGNYILVGSQQLMSVPYALYAAKSGDVLMPGFGVDINNGRVNNILPDQIVTLNGVGGATVTGTYPNFTIDAVDNINDADADPTNEIQSISKTGALVTMTNGGGSFTDEVNDADADPANEIQDLLLAGNTLSITNNGSATPIDFASYLDNTDNQNFSNVLVAGNDAGTSKITNLGDPTNPQDAATKNYVDAQDANLTTTISTNAISIINETNIRTTADAAIQTELNAIETGAGLNADGSYNADVTTTYLSVATNLKGADKLLDTEVANNASDIAANSTSIATLTTSLNTTYAFEGNFSILEVAAVVSKEVIITDNYDNFNVLSGNQFVAPENGVYVLFIHAEIPILDANFRSISLNVNGFDFMTPSSTEYIGNKQYFEKSMMVNLITGQIVKLVVTTVGPMANPMVGSISGFKL